MRKVKKIKDNAFNDALFIVGVPIWMAFKGVEFVLEALEEVKNE